MPYYCPRCGNKKIIEYSKSLDCPKCLDNQGFPLEFDKDVFDRIENESGILSVREKLGLLNTFDDELKDPEKRKRFLKSIETDLKKEGYFIESKIKN